MPTSESTCWTVIRGAAAGRPADREELARRYLNVVRAYLSARWRNSALLQDVGDAVQEVFIECFRQGGALEAAGAGRVPHFRAFFYGVIRNVARRFESRPHRTSDQLPEIEANEASLSKLFDRTWAQAMMAEAAQLQQQRASDLGSEALQRVELLRLRFEDNLPIRTIAERWGIPAEELHHAYAKARQEFRAALLEVVAIHQPGSSLDIEQEAAGLLRALS